MHAHANVADPVFHQRIGGNDELHIRALRGLWLKNRNVRQVERIEFSIARERDDHVRVANVDAKSRPLHRQLTRPHQRLGAVEPPPSEVDLKAAEVRLHVAHSPARADRQGFARP